MKELLHNRIRIYLVLSTIPVNNVERTCGRNKLFIRRNSELTNNEKYCGCWRSWLIEEVLFACEHNFEVFLLCKVLNEALCTSELERYFEIWIQAPQVVAIYLLCDDTSQKMMLKWRTFWKSEGINLQPELKARSIYYFR